MVFDPSESPLDRERRTQCLPTSKAQLLDRMSFEEMVVHNPLGVGRCDAAVLSRAGMDDQIRPVIAAALAAADDQIGCLLRFLSLYLMS